MAQKSISSLARTRVAACAALLVVTSACERDDSQATSLVAPVVDAKQALTLIAPSSAFEEAPTLVLLPDNQLNGFDGCGVFQGAYHRREDSIYVTQLRLDNASCDGDTERAQARNDFVQALSHALRISTTDDLVQIDSEWRDLTLEFEQG